MCIFTACYTFVSLISCSFFVNKRVKIWSLADAKVIRTIDHPEKICIIVFTLDSHYVITGGEDNSCKIWELSTGKLIQVKFRIN
jgi:WD40 repeat protein